MEFVENQTGGEKPQNPLAYYCIKRRKDFLFVVPLQETSCPFI